MLPFRKSSFWLVYYLCVFTKHGMCIFLGCFFSVAKFLLVTVALVVLVLGFPFEGKGLSCTFLTFVVLLCSFEEGLSVQSIAVC